MAKLVADQDAGVQVDSGRTTVEKAHYELDSAGRKYLVEHGLV